MFTQWNHVDERARPVQAGQGVLQAVVAGLVGYGVGSRVPAGTWDRA